MGKVLIDAILSNLFHFGESMTSSIKQDLDRVNTLIYNGKYPEVLVDINDLLNEGSLSQELIVKLKILKSETIIQYATFTVNTKGIDVAYKLAKEAFEQSERIPSDLFMFDSTLALAEYYRYKGKSDDFQKEVEKSEQIFEKIVQDDAQELKQREAILLRFKAVVLDRKKADISEILECYNKCIELNRKLENKKEEAKCHWDMGKVYWSKANFQKTIEYYKLCSKVLETLDDKYFLARILSLIGYVYQRMGEYQVFHEYLERALSVYEEANSANGKALIFRYLGLYYRRIGDRVKSLEYFEKNLEIYKTLKNDEMEAWALFYAGENLKLVGELDQSLLYFTKAKNYFAKTNQRILTSILCNIGEIYEFKGELDASLKLQDESMELSKEFESTSGMAMVYHRKASILWRQGYSEQAIELQKQGYELWKERGNKIATAYTLGSLIHYMTEINNIDSAKMYQQELHEISEEVGSKRLKQLFRLTEAKILKLSSEKNDILKAEFLLEEHLKEEAHLESQINALITLSEVLLLGLRTGDSEKKLDKLHRCVIKLYELTMEFGSPIYTVETLILESHVNLLLMDLDNARDKLNEALKISEERRLKRLSLKILEEQQKLTAQSIELLKLERETTSISKRMEIIRMEESVKEIRKVNISVLRCREIDSQNKLLKIII